MSVYSVLKDYLKAAGTVFTLYCRWIQALTVFPVSFIFYTKRLSSFTLDMSAEKTKFSLS